jgi:protein-disulfide isomerase
MNPRIGAVFAVAIAIAFAAVGYGVGAWNSGNGLSLSQRATTEAIVKEMLADQPTAAEVPVGGHTPLTSFASLSDAERAEFNTLVRNYLMTDPAVIRDAINELQRKDEEVARAQQVAAISTDSDRIFNSSRQVVLGNPEGDVTLVEFFDYNCGFCKRAYGDMKQLMEDDPNLRIVLKEFPVLGEGSVAAAQIAVAVHMTAPEKYGAFHDLLITEQGQVNGEKAIAAAEEIGLDGEALRSMMKDEEIEASLAEVYEIAGELNLTGTPSYVTSQEVVVGAVGLDSLKEKIGEARAACETVTC